MLLLLLLLLLRTLSSLELLHPSLLYAFAFARLLCDADQATHG